MTKEWSGDIVLKINTFQAENEEEMTRIVEDYITSLAQVGSNSLRWDEVDWDIQEEE